MQDYKILEQLKKIEVEMLKEFIKICEKLNLKYYLAYGTLLGAVRHKGFIPWDDDIDIFMPRKDYEIFLKEAQKLLPEHLFLQHLGSEPNHIVSFAKIRNSNTTFIENAVSKFKINHGVFIDIFPLDFYPNDEKEAQKFLKKKKEYDFRINSCLDYGTTKNFNTKVKILLYKIKYPSLYLTKKKRDILYQSISESEIFIEYCWEEKALVEWFGEGCMLEFEGIKAKAPKEFDKVLRAEFGDYMQFPPEEERVPHHYTGVVDVTKSYKEYI